MAYKKNPKKKDALNIKRAVESLRFQIDWGLKLLGAEKGDLFHQLAKVEVDFISELNLTQDILAIKSLIVVKLAHKFAVSQADKFFKSEWDVFLKKLKWGNSVVVAIVALFYWLFLSQPN